MLRVCVIGDDNGGVLRYTLWLCTTNIDFGTIRITYPPLHFISSLTATRTRTIFKPLSIKILSSQQSLPTAPSPTQSTNIFFLPAPPLPIPSHTACYNIRYFLYHCHQSYNLMFSLLPYTSTRSKQTSPRFITIFLNTPLLFSSLLSKSV